MTSPSRRVIAVVGATGQQGGAVVRALKAQGQFAVRALTRNPGKHRGLADEVVEADLERPATLREAFRGAYGVFLVTNAWEAKTAEGRQAEAAVRAAKEAGVKHLVWSTLPNADAISGGKIHVPHFTAKALVDHEVRAAGFEHHTFVVAPFYYQNLVGALAPQDGRWTLPIDPKARVIHMGDINELGDVVAGAFANPSIAGNGEYLPLVGELLSFEEVIGTFNARGRKASFAQVPAETFATFYPGAAEVASMFKYFEAHTYLGSDWSERIALATKVAGKAPTRLSRWANVNVPSPSLERSAQ